MSSSAASAVADMTDATGSITTIPVICGPTAAGKSGVASWLSQRRAITVISADSRQIYRGFDIGTAKPSREERRKVPHCGVDIVEPRERFSAADWVEMAHRAIEEAIVGHRIPVVVGGTGFYIGSLFRPLWAQPELDADRRAQLQAQLDEIETDELRRWCEALDPSRANLGRAQLLRAVEVALLTGARLSDLHVQLFRPPRYLPSYLLVDPGAELQTHIIARTGAMLDAGWIDEVSTLMEGIPADAPAWNATGYEAVRQHVTGELSREKMLERVIVETRQYAKRQRTWFRHQLEGDRVQRLVPGAPGWQETVDRWITEAEKAMNAPHDAK